MENEKVLSRPFNNVFSRFFYQHESTILETRKKLYSNLIGYNFNIAAQVQMLLENRANSSQSPLMGELYPCILHELVPGLENEVALDIAAAWLATYLLIVLVDNSTDKKEKIDGIIFAALHLESSKLQTFITNKKWLEVFHQSAREAIKGQIKDVELQRVINHDEEKLKAAEEKNKILSALATVYASYASEREADFMMDITHNFLCGFQMLDDILDFESDYREGNRTFLLNGVSPDEKALNREELLEQIILSGSLEKTLEQVLLSLSKIRKMVFSNKQFLNGNTSTALFDEVEQETSSLVKLVQHYETMPKKLVKLKSSNVNEVYYYMGRGGGST